MQPFRTVAFTLRIYETYKNCLFVLYSVHSLLIGFFVLPMERKPYEKALL